MESVYDWFFLTPMGPMIGLMSWVVMVVDRE